MSTSAGATGRSRLGRYHLAEPLGGGPTGEVFCAKVYGVAGLERGFAVKRFHPEFVRHADVAARLATAARSYGSLEHPRIARLHEFGVAQGQTFSAVELVEGVDLARLLSLRREVAIPVGAGAAIISQAARAIGYAHGRGFSHLGICPTNLICTVGGEIRVTDFGFLPPRLSARPSEDPTLSSRVPYLAPEQLLGEATSPASDVFQLGLVAYELWAGTKPFPGSSAFEIGQRILSMMPPDPDVPKPLLKVLRRCLARSPFERYPDAGALADAIDAATRSTPVKGDRRDIGEAVRWSQQEQASLDEGNASGTLSFPIPSPPLDSKAAALPAHPRRTIQGVPPVLGRKSERAPSATTDADDEPTGERVSDSDPTGVRNSDDEPTRVRDSDEESTTVRDSDEESTRVQGSGGQTRPVKPASPLAQAGAARAARWDTENEKTLPEVTRRYLPADEEEEENLGAPLSGVGAGPALGSLSPAGPGAKAGGGRMPTPPPVPTDGTTRKTAASRLDAKLRDGAAAQDAPRKTLSGPGGFKVPEIPKPPKNSKPGPGSGPEGGPGPGGPGPGGSEGAPAGALDSGWTGPVGAGAQEPPAANWPIGAGSSQASESAPSASAAPSGPSMSPAPPVNPAPPGGPSGAPSSRAPSTLPPVGDIGSSAGAEQIVPGAQFPAPAPMEPTPAPPPSLGAGAAPASPPKARSRVLRSVALILGLGALAAGGYLGYTIFLQDRLAGGEADAEEEAQEQRPGEAEGEEEVASAAAAGEDAGAKGTTASTAPPIADAAPPDAGLSVGDGGVVEVEPGPAGKLVVESRPRGAKVYLDGSLVGKTPADIEVAGDQHRLAVLRPGHKLYVTDVEGSGTLRVSLEEVSPPGGPAGIKVRCRPRNHNRYYVFVDGYHIGQLCPTERIGVDLGEHLVEIYDPVTDSRKSFPVEVKETRLSLRVLVD